MGGRKLFYLAVLAALLFCAVAAAQEKVIYQKKSPYNTVVVTEDDQGMRTLRFDGGVRQSVVKVGDPDHLSFPMHGPWCPGLRCARSRSGCWSLGWAVHDTQFPPQALPKNAD